MYGGVFQVCGQRNDKSVESPVWTEESIPKQWRQGLIVSLYKKVMRPC